MTDGNGDNFILDLDALGFTYVQQDRRGVLQFFRRPNRHLTEWVHDLGDEALFTWEFELGEYFAARGWQIGADEHSLHILYPRFDVRIERTIESVAVEVERLERRLSGLNLADPAL